MQGAGLRSVLVNKNLTGANSHRFFFPCSQCSELIFYQYTQSVGVSVSRLLGVYLYRLSTLNFLERGLLVRRQRARPLIGLSIRHNGCYQAIETVAPFPVNDLSHFWTFAHIWLAVLPICSDTTREPSKLSGGCRVFCAGNLKGWDLQSVYLGFCWPRYSSCQPSLEGKVLICCVIRSHQGSSFSGLVAVTAHAVSSAEKMATQGSNPGLGLEIL